jgi:Ras-related protein Rab-21
MSANRIYRGFKVVINGDSGVGKTSLVEVLLHGQFNPENTPTVGAAFYTKMFDVGGNKIRLEIWDTAGQERFRALAPMYYNGSIGCICVFSVMDTYSFEHVTDWINQYDKSQRAIFDSVVYIVANKTDFDESTWRVSRNRIEQLGKITGCEVIYVTIKDPERVHDLFQQVTKDIVRKNPQMLNPNNNVIPEMQPRLKIGTKTSTADSEESSTCSC